jgi:hypothetical protein
MRPPNSVERGQRRKLIALAVVIALLIAVVAALAAWDMVAQGPIRLRS